MQSTDALSAAPIFVVLNAGSGHGDPAQIRDVIDSVLREGGREHEITVVDDASRLIEVAEGTVERAKSRRGIIVAAGGDGTLNAVAQASLGSGCPFGVVPLGTFNYFGRTHGIATEPAEATRALLTAVVERVQVGFVNERAFLVNASLGLYPTLLEDRERDKRAWGRSRLVALWAALRTLIRGLRPQRFHLDYGGHVEDLRTLMIFVGNNRLQLAQLGLEEASAVESGALVAIVVGPVSTFALLGIALRGAFGNLGRQPGLRIFSLTELGVTPSRSRTGQVKVAMDGETRWMQAPIRFRASPDALLLLKSAAPTTAPAQH